MDSKLFPRVLVRSSGGAFEELEQLNIAQANEVVEKLSAKQESIAALKEKISTQLYQSISSQKDKKLQNKLLNFRRSIHNGREISNEKIELLQPYFSSETTTSIEAYREALKELEALNSIGRGIFNKEFKASRESLKAMASGENLRKGLLLSSQSLLERVKTYIEKHPDQYRKKELQTEQSLLKYITRMYAKTSPFSTFTNLSIGETAENTNGSFFELKEGHEPEVISHIRLNNFLYAFIQGLLFKNREIYIHFYLRPNPTIKVNDDHYLFLTNNNNSEAFQRIPLSPVLELLLELISEEKEGIRFKALVETIIEEEYIDADEEQITDYIHQLIEYGFIEYNIGVSGTDPNWDLKLVKRLEHAGSQESLARRLIDALINVRQYADDYGRSEVADRKQILKEAHQQLRGICMELHEAAGLPEEERKTEEELLEKWRKERQKLKAEEREERLKQKAALKAQAENNDAQVEENATDTAVEETEAEGKDDKAEEEKERKNIAFKHKAATYFRYKPEQIFYEDTSLNIRPQLAEKALNTYIQSMNFLLHTFKSYETRYEDRIRMAHYFREKYEKGEAIDLLTFYEEYYREYKQPEAKLLEKRKKEAYNKMQKRYEEMEKAGKGETEDKTEENEKEEILTKETEETVKKEDKEEDEFQIPDIEEIEAIGKYNNKYHEELTKTVFNLINPEVYEIQLSKETLEIRPGDEPQASQEKDILTSFGSFAQFFTEKNAEGQEELQCVVNSIFPGFGKLISRFLHIFNEDVTNTVREWNEKIFPERMLLEDCDASYFNANMHPTLLPYEVWMPNGHNNLAEDKQIPVTDIAVVLEEDKLKLKHKPSGKQINVLDLGFQGLLGRSQLYQLLEKFTAAKYIGWYPLGRSVNTAWHQALKGPDKNETAKKNDDNKDTKEADKPKVQDVPPRVKKMPRVIFNNSVILQRKKWFVPKALIPVKTQEDSDWDYYARLNIWRKEHEIPDEVFIHIVDRHELQQGLPVKLIKRITRDDYKPQYINFNNPLLVNLFAKQIVKVPTALQIIEMLPNSSQLLKFGKNRHISEFVVQWYNLPEEA